MRAKEISNRGSVCHISKRNFKSPVTRAKVNFKSPVTRAKGISNLGSVYHKSKRNFKCPITRAKGISKVLSQEQKEFRISAIFVLKEKRNFKSPLTKAKEFPLFRHPSLSNVESPITGIKGISNFGTVCLYKQKELQISRQKSKKNLFVTNKDPDFIKNV